MLQLRSATLMVPMRHYRCQPSRTPTGIGSATVLLALDARFIAVGVRPATHDSHAGDFFPRFDGHRTRGARDPLRPLKIAPQKPAEGMAYAKFVHPASRLRRRRAAAVFRVSRWGMRSARVAIGELLVPAATLALSGRNRALLRTAPPADSIVMPRKGCSSSCVATSSKTFIATPIPQSDCVIFGMRALDVRLLRAA